MSETRSQKAKNSFHTNNDPKRKINEATKFNIETENHKEIKSSKRWEECKFSEHNIHQRSYHTSVTYQNKLYIFGGYEINKGIMNDFYELELDSKDYFSWKNLNYNKENKVYPGYFL